MYELLPFRLAPSKEPNSAASDARVRELCEEGKWKEAITIIEKQAKKGLSMSHFVNKCLIQLVSGNPERSVHGWETLHRFVFAEGKAITDVEILDAIDYTVPYSIRAATVDKEFTYRMWERAANVEPKNVVILEKWFASACRQQDWTGARKVAMRGHKELDTKHSQLYRAIAACYMEAVQGVTDEAKQLALNMGIALAKKSLEMTPSLDEQILMNAAKSKTKKKSTLGKKGGGQNVQKSLLTTGLCYDAQDLKLILQLYKQKGLLKEAAALLKDDSKVGLRSKIIKGDWDMALMIIDLLKQSKSLDDQWKLCYQLLCDAAGIECDEKGSKPYTYGKAGDDHQVWMELCEVCFVTKDKQRIAKLQKLIKNDGLKKQHRCIAAIDLVVCKLSKATAKPDDVYDAFKNYFEHFLETAVAFKDVQYYLCRLTRAQFEPMYEMMKKMVIPASEKDEGNEEQMRRHILAQINLLKMEFWFNNFQNIPSEADKLRKFAAVALAVWNSSIKVDKTHNITDRRTGDDAALIAACALLQASQRTTLQTDQIRLDYSAIILLEKLLEYTKHHYGAILVLIRLYVKHGCWNSATKLFKRLDLKNLQIFNESWVLLDRAGSIFPTLNGQHNKGLHELLLHYTEYEHSRNIQCHAWADSYQQQDNYDGFTSMHSWLEQCRTSNVKALHLAELSRFNHRNRLGDGYSELSKTQTPLEQMGTIEPAKVVGFWNGKYEDIRSFKGFPDYSPNIWQYVRTGPDPSKGWIQAEQLMFMWQTYNRTGVWHSGAETAAGHEHLIGVYLGFANQQGEYSRKEYIDAGFTDAEALVARVISMMSAVFESELLVLGAADMLNQEVNDSTHGWVKSSLVAHEKNWKQCQLVFTRSMFQLRLVSTQLRDEGRMRWNTDAWEYNHFINKLSELFMVCPKFFLDRIETSKKLKKVVPDFGFPSEEFDCLSTSAIEEQLHEFMRSSILFLENAQQGARNIFELISTEKRLETYVDACLGGGINPTYSAVGTQLTILIDRKFAEDKIKDMIKQWEDALTEILRMTPEKWRKEMWSREAAQYSYGF